MILMSIMLIKWASIPQYYKKDPIQGDSAIRNVDA